MIAETMARPLRILIVENHADTLDALKDYLEDLGNHVITSMTLQQAASILDGYDCDVVLCDIGLPDGAGWQLAEALKKANRHIFAVAMSGFGANADTARSRAAGFRHHLLKPFKPSELNRVLAEAAAEKF
jgi:CheY-like chemotaxis protein